jgi:hypothetical protein
MSYDAMKAYSACDARPQRKRPLHVWRLDSDMRAVDCDDVAAFLASHDARGERIIRDAEAESAYLREQEGEACET